MSAAPANDAPGHRLSFPELEREIWVREAETVFQSARRHGLRIVGEGFASQAHFVFFFGLLQ